MTDQDKELWLKLSSRNCSEELINQEFEQRNLKVELTKTNFSISFDPLGRAFISDMYSTLSDTPMLAIKKLLIKFDINK